MQRLHSKIAILLSDCRTTNGEQRTRPPLTIPSLYARFCFVTVTPLPMRRPTEPPLSSRGCRSRPMPPLLRRGQRLPPPLPFLRPAAILRGKKRGQHDEAANRSELWLWRRGQCQRRPGLLLCLLLVLASSITCCVWGRHLVTSVCSRGARVLRNECCEKRNTSFPKREAPPKSADRMVFSEWRSTGTVGW